MAGGKRKGAGRPKGEPTTVIRVPTRLVDTIKQVIAINSPTSDSVISDQISSFKASKVIIGKARGSSSSYFPVLSKDELKILRLWLVSSGFSKSMASSRKMTSSPSKCKKAFIKYSSVFLSENSQLTGSIKLVSERYCFDD